MRPEKSRILRAWGFGLALASLAGLVAGCGGAKNAVGSNAAGSGSATVTINWPSRAIPTNTDYVLIRVFTDQELTGLRTRINAPINGGVTTATISGLPYSPVLFMAEANTNSPTATVPNPLASGSRTVTITRDAIAQVNITMTAAGTTATAGGRADPPGSAVVFVRDVPAAAAGVTLRVLLNGQVVPNVGEPATVPVSGLTAFSSVPIGVSPLTAGTYLFTASAVDASGNALARGSKDVTVVAGQETTTAIALTAVAPPTDGETGGGGTTQDLGTAVLNVTNVGAGDALLVVDPMPGDPSQHDPAPVLLQLRGAFVQNNLPISRIPVLVAGLSPGPWLFVVTTHTGLATTDAVSRVGSVTTEIAAGDRLSLDVPLGSAQSASPPKQEGDLTVRTTNITAENVSVVLVSVFDSTGRVKDQVVTHTAGVNERLVTFALPGGPYTAVAGAYGGVSFDRAAFDAALAADKTTIPSGALAIGSTTVIVQSGGAVEGVVELRPQGNAASGSINLAVVNTPAVFEPITANDPVTGESMTFFKITSSVVVKVYSMRDNQELPALRQTIVPPTWNTSDGTLISPAAQYDQIRPLRVRIDGIPTGQMRFEVTAVSSGSAVLGRGSSVAEIVPGVSPVTVTILPHGDLPAGTVLPGIGNDDPTGQNPAPRSRAWSGQPLATRFWQEWRLRRR